MRNVSISPDHSVSEWLQTAQDERYSGRWSRTDNFLFYYK